MRVKEKLNLQILHFEIEPKIGSKMCEQKNRKGNKKETQQHNFWFPLSPLRVAMLNRDSGVPK